MPSRQDAALQLFVALDVVRPSWAGALLLGVGLNETGRALALASLASGAAGLFLEADPVHLRQAQREGCCTFSVTTLEEAIRVLKNEIRQGRGVTVALSGDSSTGLAEVAARGLQPQAIVSARVLLAGEAYNCNMLWSRGAQMLHGFDFPEPIAGAKGFDLNAGLAHALGEVWQLRVDTAKTMADRRDRDQELMAALADAAADQDGMAQVAARWLRAVPSLIPRALDRAFIAKKTAA